MEKRKILIFVAIAVFTLITISIGGISPASGAILSVMYVGCVRYAVGFNGITVNSGNGVMNINYSRNEFKCYIDIEFDIDVQSRVVLSVYDMYGGLVKNLIDDNMTAGKHTLSWKSTYHPESAGPFYYKLRAGNVTEVKKVVYS